MFNFKSCAPCNKSKNVGIGTGRQFYSGLASHQQKHKAGDKLKI